jgi:CheY-like chemotaxis protein
VRTVLVVDDHAPSRMIARICLERLGPLAVFTAESGPEGLALARAERPDVILLDVSVHAGRAVLAALQADPRTATIPVVCLAARAMPDEVDELMAAGVAGVVLKPFEPMQLPDEIRRLVAAHEQAPRLAKGSVNMTAIRAALVAAGRAEPAVRRRILLVDAIDLALDGALRDHEVTRAGSAEAVARVRDGERYDLILCDLVPDRGEQLVDALAVYPDQAARVVMMTDGHASARSARFLNRMTGRVLWKPFDRADVLAMLARVARP